METVNLEKEVELPVIISVVVTKEDLNAPYANNEGCPLFRALERNGYPVVSVGGHDAHIKDSSYSIDKESIHKLYRRGDGKWKRRFTWFGMSPDAFKVVLTKWNDNSN